MFSTAQEFYSQRDDRTNRCIASNSYQQTNCLIISSEETAKSFAGQVMIMTTANLLSRWCRNIDLLTSDAPLHKRLLLFEHTTLISSCCGKERA